MEECLLLASAAVALSAVVLLKKRRKRKERKTWSRSWLQRRELGKGVLNLVNTELLSEDMSAYRNYLRLNNTQFQMLLSLIEKDIMKEDTTMRTSISAENRLQVTLRFLATGETYRSLMYATRIHETTISRFIPDVCSAILKHLRKDYLSTPCTSEKWQKIADEYWDMWQFPNCLGAIDGRHIKFRPPRSDGSFYFNYKGCNGRISDGGVFRECNFYKSFANNSLNFPPPVHLSQSSPALPYVIVGDDAFPLSKHLMKPYPNRGLTHEERIFNYRLSRARRVVENAFGILANRFRVLLTPINLRPTKVVDITLTCVGLHNFLATKNEYYSEFSVEFNSTLPALCTQGGDRSCNEARTIREEFKSFLCTVGSIPWQEAAVARDNL